MCVYFFVYVYTFVPPCVCHVRRELKLPAGLLISEKRELFHSFNPRDSKDKGRKTG